MTDYRYLETQPEDEDSLPKGIAWGLVFGLVLWLLIFLGALLLIPHIGP